MTFSCTLHAYTLNVKSSGLDAGDGNFSSGWAPKSTRVIAKKPADGEGKGALQAHRQGLLTRVPDVQVRRAPHPFCERTHQLNTERRLQLARAA